MLTFSRFSALKNSDAVMLFLAELNVILSIIGPIVVDSV